MQTLILLLTFFSLSAFVGGATNTIQARPPLVDALHQVNANKLSLAGDWAFIWNRLVPLSTLSDEEFTYQIVEIPSYLRDILGRPSADHRYAHGVATYVKEIHNLQERFRRPALNMKHISDAWEAWWIEKDKPANYLGGSGTIARSKENEVLKEEVYILDLPRQSTSGRLVIYVSAHHLVKGGFYGNPTIKEQEDTLKSLAIDLASRSFFLGLGIYVVIQNLVFFVQRPKEKVLLLLSIFCFTGVVRSLLSSGYVDYFLHSLNLAVFLIRLEYIFLIWPGIAAMHYLVYMFPIVHGRKLVQVSYSSLAIITFASFLMPIEQMTFFLNYYQAILSVYAVICITILLNGIIQRRPASVQILKSFIPVLAAVINDIYSASVAHYNFYVAEYALFLFLLLQTNIQAARFVIALETSEHLTQNLKAEVDRKTAQLSERNAILEEKATNLKAKHKEVKLLSETDYLTGLYNRQSLEYRSEILYQMASSFNQPLSVIMIDLDNFKEINDRYGHLFGDECLIFVASFLRGYHLRKRDLIARYGGEEIIIMLSDTDIAAATDIANKLREGIKQYPVEFEQLKVHLTASFGVVEMQDAHSTSIQHLIACADQALYLAKQNGRNRVEIYQSKILTD